MCRRCDEGGRRCQTKEQATTARRHARKAATATAIHQATLEAERINVADLPPRYGTITPTFTGDEPVEVLQAEGARLKTLMAEEPEDELERTQHRKAVEEQVTAFGMALSARAEKLAGVDVQAVNDSLDKGDPQLMKEWAVVSATLDKTREAWLDIQDLPEDEVDPDKFDAVFVAYDEAQEEWNRYDQLDKDWQNNQILEARQKITAANRAVIAELRPVGGNIISHASNPAELTSLLQNTVGNHMPTSWIESSNDLAKDHAFTVGIQEKKAFYHRAYPNRDFKPEDFPDDVVMRRGTNVYEVLVPAHEAHAVAEALGEEAKVLPGSTVDQGGEPHWVVSAPGVQFNTDEDRTPEQLTADGWEYRHYLDAERNGLSEKPAWVKPINELEPIVQTAHLVLPPVKENPNPGETTFEEGTAFHEFGHRFEHVVNNGAVEKLEEAFLARRTTNLNTGERDPLVLGNPGFASWVGRPDNFISNYVGREYVGQTAREVFTTGIESVFSGSMGALDGLKARTDDRIKNYSQRADPDHKGFIMGLLGSM